MRDDVLSTTLLCLHTLLMISSRPVVDLKAACSRCDPAELKVRPNILDSRFRFILDMCLDAGSNTLVRDTLASATSVETTIQP